MSISQYLGRKVDLVAMQGSAPGGPILLQQRIADPGDDGSICTGVLKLAQDFAIELLTPLGSIPFLPRRGSSFMLEVMGGGARSGGDVSAVFSRALIDIERNLGQDVPEDTPDDERLERADVLDATVVGDRVSLKLKIVSVAGSSAVVIFPLPTTI